MSKGLFLSIATVVAKADDNFKSRKVCCGQLSFSPMQNCMATLRMFAYGKVTDALDIEIWTREIACLNTIMVQFACAMVMAFGP